MRRRRLGQHYLVDEEVARSAILAADIRKGESVLEIGTGRGALTKDLARLAGSFEGFEIDRGNYELTLEAVKGTTGKVVLGDAFKVRPKFDVLVSSLPYSKSATFVEWISQANYDRAVVLLQEDFVEKVLAEPGTKEYRGISAIAQASSKVEVVSKVARSAFSPQPKVNSVMVSLRPRRKLSGGQVSRIKRLFTLRKRKVNGALKKLGMGEAGSLGDKRVYSLTPEEVIEICGRAT